MLAIQEKVCRAANKVALNVGYAVGATGEAVSAVRLLDAFSVTADLLLELRLSNIRESYAQATKVLAGAAFEFDLSSPVWSACVAQQCELLHRANLQELTIKEIGDELSSWTFQPLDSQALNISLDQLEYVSNCEAEQLTRHWFDSDSAYLSARAKTIFRIHCGLAVLTVTLTDLSAIESERLIPVAPAVFGATLVENGSREVFEAARQMT